MEIKEKVGMGDIVDFIKENLSNIQNKGEIYNSLGNHKVITTNKEVFNDFLNNYNLKLNSGKLDKGYECIYGLIIRINGLRI